MTPHEWIGFFVVVLIVGITIGYFDWSSKQWKRMLERDILPNYTGRVTRVNHVTQVNAAAADNWGRTPDPIKPRLNIPDVQEVLAGWRSYNWDWSTVTTAPDGSQTVVGYLRGAYNVVWKQGTLTARCQCDRHSLCGGDPEVCIASETCTCGIYSYKHRPGVADPNAVLARVVNGGVVNEGSWGYRAQITRIEHLYVFVGAIFPGDNGYTPEQAERIANDLERIYDCTVELTTIALWQEETQQQWATLAHMSEQYVRRYRSEHPSLLPSPSSPSLNA